MGIFDPIVNGELDRNNLPIKEGKGDSLDIFGKPRYLPLDVSGGRLETFDIPTSTEDAISFNPGQNREDIKARYQSGWELAGKAIVQSVGEAALGTLEGVGYLADWQQLGNIAQGTEDEFGNWFSDIMKAGKEHINEEVAPIYQTESAQQGFAPGDASWWASNANSIASTASLLIPAMGATKVAGLMGKALRGTQALSKINKAAKLDDATDAVKALNSLVYGNKAAERASGVTGAVFSRYMENTMEASGTYDEHYQRAIGEGKDPQLAAKEAGEAASTAWNNNWGNLVFDIAQYMTLTKGINSANYASKEFRKNLLQKTLGTTGNILGEGIEEGAQFVVSKEAQRKAEMGDDYEGFKDITTRISDYSKDPEFKASVLLGAVGGGIFTGVGKGVDKAYEIAQSGIRKQAALDKGDLEEAYQQDAKSLLGVAYRYASEGKLNDLKGLYKKMGEASDEELKNRFNKTDSELEDFRKSNKEMQEDLDYIEKAYVRLENDSTKKPELRGTELTSLVKKRFMVKARKEITNKVNAAKQAAIDANNTPEVVRKKELGAELLALTILKGKYEKDLSKISYGKDVISKFDADIAKITEELDTLKEVKVKDFSSAEDSDLQNEVMKKKAAEMEETVIDATIDKAQTTKGQEELLKDIENQRKEAFLSAISDDMKFSHINDLLSDGTLKTEAKAKITALANKAAKDAPIPSDNTFESDVASRYKSIPLLHKELAEIKEENPNVSTNDVVDAQSFINKHKSDRQFREAVDAYYAAKTEKLTKQQTKDVKIPSEQEMANAASREHSDGLPVETEASHNDKGNLQSNEFIMYIRKGDTVKFYGTNDKKLRAGIPLSVANTMGYREFKKDGMFILYSEDGSPVKAENNTLTDLNGREITFLSDRDFEVINDPNINIYGKEITFEIPIDHTFGPTLKGVADFVVIPTININGEKIKLGKLRATYESSTGDDVKTVRELRQQLFAEWKQSGQKTGTFISGRNDIKVDGRTPGHFNISGNDRIDPTQVTDDLFLGTIHEDEGRKRIEFNDGDVDRGLLRSTDIAYNPDSSIPYGSVAMMVKRGDGKYSPIKLYTSFLKEHPEETEIVNSIIDELFADTEFLKLPIGSTEAIEKLDSYSKRLLEYIPIKLQSHGKGRFVVSTIGKEGDNKENHITYTSAEAMKADMLNKVMRVDASKINTGTYNEDIAGKGWITTNLTPGLRKTIGSMIKLDLRGFDKGRKVEKAKVVEPATVGKKTTIAKDVSVDKSSSIKTVYHHTSVPASKFDFNNFKRGKNQVTQFGDGLSVSSTTTPFLQKRYGNPIEGEINEVDFIEVDTNKSEAELYDYFISLGYKINTPQNATGKYNTTAKEEYDSTERTNDNPAVFNLFNDFQQSNPEVKGVKVINHIIQTEKVDPFYVVYDAKSFYGKSNTSQKSDKDIWSEYKVQEIANKIISGETLSGEELAMREAYAKEIEVILNNAKPEIETPPSDQQDNVQVLGDPKEQEGVKPLISPKRRSSARRKGKDDNGVTRNRIAVGESQKWDKNKELLWFNANYPNIPVKVLDDLSKIANNGGVPLWGLFKNSSIYIANNAASGTVYHEAFHAVFHILLNSNERANLLREFKGKDAIDKEEAMADHFMNYKLTQGGDTRGLSAAVKDFFKRLYHLIQIAAERVGLKKDATVQDYMYRVDKGLYSKFKNNENFSKDVSRFRSADGVLNPREEVMAIGTVNSIFINDTIDDYRTSLRLSKDTSASDVVREVLRIQKDGIKDLDIVKDLYIEEYDLEEDAEVSEEELTKFEKLVRANFSLEGMYATTYETILYELDENAEDYSEAGIKYLEKIKDSFATEAKGGGYLFSTLMAKAAQDLSVRFGIGISVNRIMSDEMLEFDEASFDGVLEAWQFDAFLDQFSKFSERAKMMFAKVEMGVDPADYVVYENPIKIYAKLARVLSASPNETTMMSKLEDIIGIYPQYEAVKDIINNDSDLRGEMWKNIGQKHPVPFIGQSSDKVFHRDGTQSKRSTAFVSNQKSASSDIISEWQSNFYASELYNRADGKVTLDNSYLERIDALISDTKGLNSPDVPQEHIDTLFQLLKDINIPVFKNALNRVFGSNEGKVNFNKFLGNLDDGLRSVIKGMTEAKDPFFGGVGSENSLKVMANIIVEGTDDSYKMSFKSMSGKLNYTLVDNRFSLDLINKLKSKELGEALLATYRKDPFFKNSPFLAEFKRLSTAQNIQIVFVDAYKNEDRSKVLEYKDMTRAQLEAFQMINYFRYDYSGKANDYAYFMLPILSDSTSPEMITFKKETDEAKIREKLVKTAQQERDRIEWLKDRIAPVEDAYKQWRFDQFSDKLNSKKAPLPIELSDIDYNVLKNGTEYQIFTDLNGDTITDKNFATKVNNMVNRVLNLEKGALYEERVLEMKNGRSVDLTDMLGNTIVNNLDKNLDMYVLNRMYMNIQTLFMFGGDIASYKSKKGDVDFTDVYKRIKQVHSPQNKLSVDTSRTFKLKDGSSVGVRENYNVTYLQDPTEVEAIVSTNLDLIKELFPNKEDQWIVEKYSDLNNTDAATYIDIFRAREIYLGTAEWNDALQDQYDQIIAGKPITFDKDNQVNVKKPFHYSHRFITDKANPNLLHAVATQIKNSEAVLTPQMAKGNPKLEAILEKMGYEFNSDGTVTFDESKRITDAVVFTSAVKVGQFNVVNNVADISPTNIHQMKNSEYAIQQATPEHHIDSEVLAGTQIRKIISQDLNKTALYNVGGRIITGEQLFNEYQEAINQNILASFEELKKLFYKKDGTPDLESIVKILRKEAIEKGYGEDTLSAFDWLNSSKTETVLPLWDPSISYNVEAIMNSYFKNNITKQKMFGVSLYNASSYGYEVENTKGLRKPQIVIERDSEGKPYIKEVEVLMPAHSKAIYEKYTGADGYLDINAVPDDLKMGIFYRIPTEGKYSMFHIKVIGYIEGVGGQIIMPDEVTTIAGLDFDIDKLYGMMYNFKEVDGKLVKVPSGMDSKEARDNMLIDLQYAVMSHPDTIRKQLTPGNYNTLNEAKKRVIELEGKGNQVLNPMFLSTQREVFDRNMTGNALIGIAANHNVNHSLMMEGEFNFRSEISFNGEDLKSLSNSHTKKSGDYKYDRYSDNNYEVSSAGDKRFSALYAKLSDGRTIEEAYQLDIKGYRKQGNDWKLGKGKKPLADISIEESQKQYTDLWRQYLNENPNLKEELKTKAKGKILTDKFTANNAIVSQAKSLAEILNEDNGKLISASTAEYVAAVVDNAKDPTASFLNLTTITLDASIAMVRTGHDMYAVNIFMASPAAKNFSKRLSETGTSRSDIKATLEKLMLEEKDNIRSMSAMDKFDEYMKIPMKDRVTLSKIEDTFTKDTVETKYTNYSIYELLKSTFEKSNSLVTTMRAMRFDTLGRAAGPRIADTMVLQRAWDEAIKEDGNQINGFKKFIESGKIPYVKSFYEMGILMPKEDIVREEEVTIEIPVEKPTNITEPYSFTYKGRTIGTEFQLSNDQQFALQKLIDFTESGDPRFVLQGAAGTGKTSIIGYLSKYLGEQMLYMAPTHAATVELAFATTKTGNKRLPITVASGLAQDRRTGKYKLSQKAERSIGFGGYIVIDEVSMLSTSDYVKVKDLQSSGYRVIFLGDKKQIPEVIVSGGTTKNVSNAFTENPSVSLDTIHRTSNNNIKNILQNIRDSKEFQLFKPKENTENIKFYGSDIEFKKQLKKIVTEFPEDTDYIAYTNESVSRMNKLIRENVFGRKGLLQKGDIIMGYLGYASKQIERGNLANSVSYTVESVNKVTRPTLVGYEISMKSKRLEELLEQGVKGIHKTPKTIYLPLFPSGALENDLTTEEYALNNKHLSSLFRDLYDALSEAKKNNNWIKFYQAQEALSSSVSSLDIDVDVIYNYNSDKMELYNKSNPSQSHKGLYGGDKSKFTLEKGIDYGHAITIHKSQGKTTKNVFFDANTITNRDTKILENGEQISTERQSLGYVGMSRASENLYVNEGWVNFEEVDNVSEEQATVEEVIPTQPVEAEVSGPQTMTIKRPVNKYKNIILDVTGLPYDKPLFTNIVERFGLFNQDGSLSGDEIANIYSHINTALITGYSTFKQDQIIRVVESIPNRVRQYKLENPEGPYSLLMEQFIPKEDSVNDRYKKDKSPFPYVEFNRTGLDPIHKASMESTWKRMLHSENADEKKLAEDLKIYSMFNTGFTFNFNTFSDILPVSFTAQLQGKVEGEPSYREYLSHMHKREFNKDQMAALFEQIVRNGYRSMRMIPFIDPREDKSISKKQIDGEMFISVPFKTVAFDGKDPLTGKINGAIPYIKVPTKTKEGVTTMLYRLDNIDGGNVLYKPLGRLGIHNKFIEYDITNLRDSIPSVYPTLNVILEKDTPIVEAETIDANDRKVILEEMVKAATMMATAPLQGQQLQRSVEAIKRAFKEHEITMEAFSAIVKEASESDLDVSEMELNVLENMQPGEAEEIMKHCRGNK